MSLQTGHMKWTNAGAHRITSVFNSHIRDSRHCWVLFPRELHPELELCRPTYAPFQYCYGVSVLTFWVPWVIVFWNCRCRCAPPIIGRAEDGLIDWISVNSRLSAVRLSSSYKVIILRLPVRRTHSEITVQTQSKISSLRCTMTFYVNRISVMWWSYQDVWTLHQVDLSKWGVSTGLFWSRGLSFWKQSGFWLCATIMISFLSVRNSDVRITGKLFGSGSSGTAGCNVIGSVSSWVLWTYDECLLVFVRLTRSFIVLNRRWLVFLGGVLG